MNKLKFKFIKSIVAKILCLKMEFNSRTFQNKKVNELNDK